MRTRAQTRNDVRAFETLLEFMMAVKVGAVGFSRTGALDYIEGILAARRKRFPFVEAKPQPTEAK